MPYSLNRTKIVQLLKEIVRGQADNIVEPMMKRQVEEGRARIMNNRWVKKSPELVERAKNCIAS